MDSKAIMKMLKEKFELGTRFLILKGRPVVTTIWQQIKAKDWKALMENKNVRIALIVVLALLLIKSCGGCGGSKVNVTKAPSAEVYNRYGEYIDIFENYFYGDNQYRGFFFSNPDANGEGIGVHGGLYFAERGVFYAHYKYEFFKYKIKPNGRIDIYWGKEPSYQFIREEYVEAIWENSDIWQKSGKKGFDREYQPVNQQFRVFHERQNNARLECWIWSRGMNFYNLSKAEDYYYEKRYDEGAYEEAMKMIKDCWPTVNKLTKW